MKAIIKGAKPAVTVKSVKLNSTKLTPPKKGSPAHVATIKKAAVKAEKKESAPREALVDKILRLTVEAKIDGPTVWLGNGTKRQLWDQLVAKAAELKAAKLRKTNEVLLVMGKVAFAWSVTGTDGQVYERMHGRVPVRGSLALLKKEYGANNVKFVTLEKLKALVKQVKFDPGCKAELGLA